MARWECIVCGLIYDEREGWPEDGIAPGTRWADVPDDWTCPDCGVGKDDFELVPGSESDEMPPASTSESEQSESAGAEPTVTSEAVEQPVTIAPSGHVVIVGSGLAGFGLARELRRHNPELPITLVTADGGEVYSKPLLSTGYTKKLGYEQLALQTAEDFAAQLGITVLTRTRVSQIDSERKLLQLERGGAVSYGSLVLATGADVIRPPLAGDGAEDVLSINDLDDYAQFQTIAQERAVKKSNHHWCGFDRL
jgi:rubredoxin-NAD+ reductase